MADLPELDQFDTGVYQIETVDPVIGGLNGISNKSAKNLVNRTRWLYNQIAALWSAKAPLASPSFTGAPLAPTAAVNTNTTQIATTAFVNGEIANDRPWGSTSINLQMNGTAAVGILDAVARLDHIHPTDTSRAPLASPNFSGTPQADTAAGGTATRQIASTQFVVNEIPAARPYEAIAVNIKMNGAQAVGVNNTVARGDHVHPTDATRAPVNSPTLTGTPFAPTAAVNDNSAQIATTAFVNNEIANDRPFEDASANIAMNGLRAAGYSNTVARGNHVHPTDTSRAPINSPAFSGNPTCPTPSDTNNSVSLINSLWAKLGFYQADSGSGVGSNYFVFSAPYWLGGWTIQAGYVDKVANNATSSTPLNTKSFPIAFANRCIWCGLMSNAGMVAGVVATEGAEVWYFDRFSFSWQSDWNHGDSAGILFIPYLAIGR